MTPPHPIDSKRNEAANYELAASFYHAINVVSMSISLL